MEKVVLNNVDTVSPDSVVIAEWGIELHCMDSDAFPIIYGEKNEHRYDIPRVLTSYYGATYHYDLVDMIHKSLLNQGKEYICDRRNDVYARIWVNENVISCWSSSKLSGDEIKQIVVNIVNDIKENNYLSFTPNMNPITSKLEPVPQNENTLASHINFDELTFYWKQRDEDENGYDFECAFREKVNNLLSSDNDINIDDSQQKLLHLMTPAEKANAIKNNDELRKEREEYFKEGEHAWLNKHGDIDPAQYHLLMYQEGKQKMKVTEDKIREIVSESIKRILKENNEYMDLDFGKCNFVAEKLQRTANVIQSVGEEIEKTVEKIKKLTPQYGFETTIRKGEFNEDGYVLTVSYSITNSELINADDLDINNPDDLKYYFEDSIEDIFYNMKQWREIKYISRIATFGNELIEFELDDLNPYNIANNLPDV